MNDTRRHSPAAERNRGPLLEVLQATLPQRGSLLEIASGTGQHAAHFAAHLPQWAWQPSDAEPTAFASIQAWTAGLANVHAPLLLDVTASHWPLAGRVDAMFCANLLHIAPWAVCEALMQGAARHLAEEGVLITYGPYKVEGEPLAPGNQAFDADLRARNPAWGLRWLHDVAAAADAAGLRLLQRIAMPANNLSLVWRRGTVLAPIHPSLQLARHTDDPSLP